MFFKSQRPYVFNMKSSYSEVYTISLVVTVLQQFANKWRKCSSKLVLFLIKCGTETEVIYWLNNCLFLGYKTFKILFQLKWTVVSEIPTVRAIYLISSVRICHTLLSFKTHKHRWCRQTLFPRTTKIIANFNARPNICSIGYCVVQLFLQQWSTSAKIEITKSLKGGYSLYTCIYHCVDIGWRYTVV